MNKELIEKEHERITALKDGEYMRTTFGPQGIYFIQREGEKLFLYTGKWFLNKIEGKHDITTAEQLSNFLLIHPEHYAKNEFSGELIHHDNYERFLKAFTIQLNKSLSFESKGKYYEENFRDTLDFSGGDINFRSIFGYFYEDLAAGRIQNILLHAKESIKLTLNSLFFLTNHRGEKEYIVALKLYDESNQDGFQLSHLMPIPTEKDFDWQHVETFYSDLKTYFDSWNKDFEMKLMAMCEYVAS